LYNKWKYKTDIEFAIDVLRRSPTKHQSHHNSPSRCCTECSDLLHRHRLRTVNELGVVISGCDLCKYLRGICDDLKAQISGETQIKRKGSDLVLGRRRILTIRSDLGMWLFPAFTARLISVHIDFPNANFFLRKDLRQHSSWARKSATRAGSSLFRSPSSVA
jgi:hypothetical protein